MANDPRIVVEPRNVGDFETKYYGIWIQEDEGHWWICAADGNDKYCGPRRPTDADVDAFRDAIVGETRIFD